MTYVVFSFLLAEKLLQRPRKGRYRFPAPREFPVQAASLWERLTRASGGA
jgi:hypothetical protein